MSAGQIDNPVRASAPSGGLNRLFRSTNLRTYTTASIADGEQEVIAGGVRDGLFLVYVVGSTDQVGLFTITGGDTVTLVEEFSATAVMNTTFETDGDLNIDITSGNLRINNELGSAKTVAVAFLCDE